MPVESRFLELIRTVVAHQVDAIVVGGIAAILHGAPVMTADLDLLFDPAPENLARIDGMLRALEAHYADSAGRHIVPTSDKLADLKIHLLRTRFGRLDLLRTIGQGEDFASLKQRSQEFEIDGLRIRVLDLEAIIATKQAAGRPKDLAALPFLLELQALRDLR
jgi:hypothetical protein